MQHHAGRHCYETIEYKNPNQDPLVRGTDPDPVPDPPFPQKSVERTEKMHAK